MSGYHDNSIFWIETEKIQPNPYQPRREFEPGALEDLADSLRQYGVLQPLVVTRKEMPMEEGHGMKVFYELIAGERRLRASKIAGLHQVPVIIRKETDDKVKLELAIIENLQREDLNPIDRALAFEQLYKQFNLTHAEIGKRMGKSRVYVSNSLRLLSLPPEIRQGLMDGRITEGHTRPLLMLSDKPEEQATLYKEIMLKKMSVRESEKVARKIAQDRVRKKEFIVDPRIRDYEQRLSENLGTRVHIEQKEKGGKITIDYFTLKDLDSIISAIKKTDDTKNTHRMMDQFLESQQAENKAKDLENSTQELAAAGLQITEDVAEATSESLLPESFHQGLPEFHHNKNEEIVVHKEEIEAPLVAQEPVQVPAQEAFNEPVAQESFSVVENTEIQTTDNYSNKELVARKQETAPVADQHIDQDSTQQKDLSELLADLDRQFDQVLGQDSEPHDVNSFGQEVSAQESVISQVHSDEAYTTPVAGQEVMEYADQVEEFSHNVVEPQTPAASNYQEAPYMQQDTAAPVHEYTQQQAQAQNYAQEPVYQQPQQQAAQVVHHTYTGPYHNPHARQHAAPEKKKGFFRGLFK